MNKPELQKYKVFESIGKNAELKEEILEKIKQKAVVPDTSVGEDNLEMLVLDEGMPSARTAVDDANTMMAGGEIHNDIAEAIILSVGRPVIRVRENKLVDEDIESNTVRQQLEPHHSGISQVVQSVGRIELNGHRIYPWVGTGWIIDDDIIVTNRHVAREFGHFTGATFDFLPGVFGGPIETRIDFLQEHGSSDKAEFQISKVIYIEPEGGPDIAFLQVNWSDGNVRNKLDLWEEDIDFDRQVAVVGYPAKDTRTNMSSRMDEIYKNIYNVKRFAPGFVMGISASNGLLTHDCTTLGGNSGSAILDIESGKVVGLHFSGREEDANFAVIAPVVHARLIAVRAGTTITTPDRTFSNEVEEEKPTVDTLQDRAGYDPEFLDERVDLPIMSDGMKSNLAPVHGRDDGELKYTHYSVLMHKERRCAFYAVVNIDGAKLHGVPRGSDKWFFDPRIDLEHQVGNELYKSNPLDRGHLVRRLDPSWGAARDVAELAVEDSFFYTNCAPQHLSLNRRMWLGLEDHILNNSGNFDLKVSVFSGPVFHDDDQEYRGIQIPNELWKVVAMTRPDDETGAGSLSATGYVLSQKSLVDNLEFVFGDHQGYQVKIALIEELTGLDFGALKDADPLTVVSNQESVGMPASDHGHRLVSYRDIVL